MPRDQALVVTGMHRSGTSVIAQAAFQAGVFLGDNLILPDESNSDGYFEDADIIAFHDRILRANNATVMSSRSLRTLKVSSEDRELASDMLRRKFSGRTIWGWKDPRTVLFLDFWGEIRPDARFIFVFRHPDQVAWSLVRRRDFERGGVWGSRLVQSFNALGTWVAYNRMIVDFMLRNSARCILLCAPEDFASPMSRRVCELLKTAWGVPLEGFDISTVYKPNLMKSSVPRWLRLLTTAHVPSQRVLADLMSLRLARVVQRQGPARDSDRSALAKSGASTRRPTVCIVVPSRTPHEEYFIRDHIQRMPADVKVLYGLSSPLFRDDTGGPLLSQQIFRKLARGVMRKWLRLPTGFFVTRALRSFSATNHVCAVLAEYGAPPRMMRDALTGLRIPLYAYFHPADIEAHSGPVSDPHYSTLFKRAAALMVGSRMMGQSLIEWGAPADKIRYIPYGVDTSLFTGASPEDAPPHFVAAGLEDEASAVHLFQSFRQVWQRVPNATLTVVDNGSYLSRLQHLVAACGLHDAVSVRRRSSDAELALLLRSARSFVLPSSGAGDLHARASLFHILAAHASGLPVIAMTSPYIREALVDGVTGFLLTSADGCELEDRLLWLAKSPRQAGQMGRSGMQRVRESFSLTKSLDMLWDVISKSVAEGENGTIRTPSRIRSALLKT